MSQPTEEQRKFFEEHARYVKNSEMPYTIPLNGEQLWAKTPRKLMSKLMSKWRKSK